ncbi:MAG: hypothetical protein KGI00_03240 [Candidatus Micrarchaeota archaeon]|nr:hypothetical protein [Candidatus Micrarchaeota archaeon]
MILDLQQSKDINDATTIFILAFTLLYLAGVSIGIYVHISNVILIASLIVAVLLVIGAYIGLANTFKSARTELQSIQNEGRTQIKEKRDEKQGGM